MLPSISVFIYSIPNSSMADGRALEQNAPTPRTDDREEAILASPSVQATVAGEIRDRNDGELLERGPRPTVAVECLLDQGVEPGTGGHHRA